jgi:hypothetical protein
MKNLIYLLLISFLSCNNNLDDTSKKLIKNSEGEICIAIVEQDSIFRLGDAFDLTKTEVKKVGEILIEAVDEINNAHTRKYLYEYDPAGLIKLEDYKRQYCPYLNEKGEKEVFVYCFCRPDDNNWTKHLEISYGGGKCYFGGTINLTNGTYKEFYINSPK